MNKLKKISIFFIIFLLGINITFSLQDITNIQKRTVITNIYPDIPQYPPDYFYVGSYHQAESLNVVKLRTVLNFDLDKFNGKTIVRASLILKEEQTQDKALNSVDSEPLIQIHKISNSGEEPTWENSQEIGFVVGQLEKLTSDTYRGDITNLINTLQSADSLLLKVQNEEEWNLRQFSIQDSYLVVDYTGERNTLPVTDTSNEEARTIRRARSIGTIMPQNTKDCPDINDDGDVNIADLLRVALVFQKPVTDIPTERADIDNNGKVDILDLTEVSTYFGQKADTVPSCVELPEFEAVQQCSDGTQSDSCSSSSYTEGVIWGLNIVKKGISYYVTPGEARIYNRDVSLNEDARLSLNYGLPTNFNKIVYVSIDTAGNVLLEEEDASQTYMKRRIAKIKYGRASIDYIADIREFVSPLYCNNGQLEQNYNKCGYKKANVECTLGNCNEMVCEDGTLNGFCSALSSTEDNSISCYNGELVRDGGCNLISKTVNGVRIKAAGRGSINVDEENGIIECKGCTIFTNDRYDIGYFQLTGSKLKVERSGKTKTAEGIGIGTIRSKTEPTTHIVVLNNLESQLASLPSIPTGEPFESYFPLAAEFLEGEQGDGRVTIQHDQNKGDAIIGEDAIVTTTQEDSEPNEESGEGGHEDDNSIEITAIFDNIGDNGKTHMEEAQEIHDGNVAAPEKPHEGGADEHGKELSPLQRSMASTLASAMDVTLDKLRIPTELELEREGGFNLGPNRVHLAISGRCGVNKNACAQYIIGGVKSEEGYIDYEAYLTSRFERERFEGEVRFNPITYLHEKDIEASLGGEVSFDLGEGWELAARTESFGDFRSVISLKVKSTELGVGLDPNTRSLFTGVIFSRPIGSVLGVPIRTSFVYGDVDVEGSGGH